MSNNSFIIPECYVDSCLIEVLIIAGKNHVNHQKGNGTVAKEMKETFEDSFCIGIIDEDRRQLDYLQEFGLVKETSDLKLWKHNTKHQYLIQLRPVVERWIKNICDVEGIDLTDFGLPKEIKELSRVSKSVTSKTDLRFMNLFKQMRASNNPSVIQLVNWIQYLREKRYNVDINELGNV